MKDTIKLHEICGYLPYGMKVRWCDGKVDKINPWIDYDAKSEGEIDLQLFLFVIHETDTPEDLKPLLRPLSDLTKEIEHNGERFVPIYKLLDVETSMNWSNTQYLKSEHGLYEQWVQFKDKPDSFVFGFNSEKLYFYMHTDNKGNNTSVKNQYKLFQKLHEWHFDIHGLINRNLALNLNDYEI